ncbi:hypothetical protein WJS89_01135 [Sphingomicrobium sp. XHP0235]|uniref:hypothetical protein n=1 Tax=Sphingomicrobium aquimarinum TaxID=3133971 RepID=UPI0031FEAACF
MALGALIAANGETGGVRHALVPVGGQAVLDLQVRLLAAAGMAPIIVYSEGPHEVVEARVERLRAEGFPVHHAAESRDAAARFAPDERMVLVADGLIPDADRLASLHEEQGLSIEGLLDGEHSARFERIDLEWRWAGLAVASGEQVRSTAAMAGDWDLVSTLLRRLVQARVPIRALDDPEGDVPLLIHRASDALPFEQRQKAAARRARPDLIARALIAPLETLVVERIVSTATPTRIFWGAGIVLLFAAFLLILLGWPILAGLALILSLPFPQIERSLAARRLQIVPKRRRELVSLFRIAVLIAFGVPVAAEAGWLAVPLVASALAFARLYRVEAARRPVANRWALVATSGNFEMLIIAAALVTAAPLVGLMAILLHTAASFVGAYLRSGG